MIVEAPCRAGDAAEARGTGFPRELDCLGAVLSARGIPTPNFFTGAYNFHSRFEFLPVQAFERSLEVAAKICQVAASSRQFHGACQQASLAYFALGSGSPQIEFAGHTQVSGNPIAAEATYCCAGAVF